MKNYAYFTFIFYHYHVCVCVLIFACACFVLQPQVNSNNDSTPNDHVTLTDTSEPSNETLEFFGSEMADLQNLLTSIMAGNVCWNTEPEICWGTVSLHRLTDWDKSLKVKPHTTEWFMPFSDWFVHTFKDRNRASCINAYYADTYNEKSNAILQHYSHHSHVQKLKSSAIT